MTKDDSELRSVAKGAVLDMLAAGAELAAAGIFLLSVKAESFVAKGRGAMLVDHSDARVISLMTPDEGLGSCTFIPPEVIPLPAPGRPTKGPLTELAIAALGVLVRRDALAAKRATSWLHGHAVYQALTGKVINNWSTLGLEPYPSLVEITNDLEHAAKAPGNEWLVGHESDLASLLNPDPLGRGDLAAVILRLSRQDF